MPSWWSRWDWKNWSGLHTLSWLLVVAGGADELLLAYLKEGNPLPWHITAAGLVLAGKFIDLLTHSMAGSTGAKDMLGMVAPGAPPEVKASVKPFIPPITGATLCMLLSGCISSAPIVLVTPGNQAQVSSCQSIASLHNGVVIGGFVVGGATAGLAGVAAAATDSTTKNDLAIGAAIAGALGVVGTAIAGFTSSNFANSQCSSVVGPLAAKKPEAAQ